ncbi:unnamed protein product [Prorocentrum cordatum]|uniref:Uncharacterized protein n=1 Tax=Prorocentrum cordatum TaxID=2364126 RepID=A0ABN9Q151_9DINO|nr:unnamed protein product [Polarella glacialis]
MARSQRGGSSGGRSRAYWMCRCGCWNWDWRPTCLSCGYAAPPWATEAPRGKAKPEAGKDGWVDQLRGRRAQRQARSAASRTASTKSQTSASAASGAPSNGSATAIERLRATVERLEALQAGPPDGVDSCFTDVVANQLEAKRAELAIAQKEAAEQKASAMPRSALLHKEANAISKEEKRLRSARQALEQKQAARDLAEVQLQKAQDELAALDGEVGEASRALQLDKLPEAWGSSNFEVAWAAVRAQVEAARAQLAVPPPAPERAPWAEACPMDEISSDDGELAGGDVPRPPQAAAERGQAERRGSACGEWPQAAMPVFIPHADGGVRPIVNGPLPMRIWGSPRQPVDALWEAEHDHRFFRGNMDRKFDKAGRRRSARAAVAAFGRVRGFATASLGLGITSFYEHQRRAFLWRCGVEHGFDLWVLRGMRVLYQECLRTECEPLEPCAVRAGCARSRHPGGPQGTPPPSATWRNLSPQRTAKGSEGFAVCMLATFAGPAVEEVRVDCSPIATCLRRGRAYATAPNRAAAHLWGKILACLEPRTFEVKKVPAHCARQAVPDGLLTEAQRRGIEHADRPTKMGAHVHAVDGQSAGEHHALAEFVLELGRWIWRAAIIWHNIEAKDCEGLPPTAERRQFRFAAAEASQAAEEAASTAPRAKRPRLERACSAGSSSAALSASAVAFSIMGHAVSYACTGEGGRTYELVACAKYGAYMTL